MTAETIRLADYAAPAFWVKEVRLTFDLSPDETVVSSWITLSRNIPSPLFQRRVRGTVTATLGQIERSTTVSL